MESNSSSASAKGSQPLWQIQAIVGIGGFLSAINGSVMAVALPTVSQHFRASASAASWIVLSYMLAATALVFVFGRAADILGRRRMFLSGLGLLSISSVFAGLAPNVTFLIAFICMQGVGAAALLCSITTLLTDSFPSDKLPSALGINVTIASLAQVLGPVLGGLLASRLGWRAVFWFNVPLGLAGLVWAWISLHSTTSRAKGESFDYFGAVLSTLGLGGLILAISQGGILGWTSRPVLLGIGLFMICTPVFLLVQSRRRHPLLELALFADRARSLAYLSLFLMAMAYYAVVLLMSLYLQAAGGMSADQAGTRVLYVAVGMAIASPIAGQLRPQVSVRVLTTIGLTLSTLGLFALAIMISPDLSEMALGMCLCTIGAGVGLFMTPNTSAIMSSVRPERRGIANGVRQTVQNAGWTLSTAVSLTIVTMSLPGPLKKAAYAGDMGTLDPQSLTHVTGGYRCALLILCGVCAAGCVASLARSRDPQPELTHHGNS
ncbi:hypothetical protein A5717_24400 [Mycolicibacterium porcinum]|nr:hypothetical protein A5717_24400 [Mycolicibacterium porcinum]